MPDLKSSPEDVFKHAMEGDVTDESRTNLQEALLIMQFQVLIQQRRTAVAQWCAAAAAFLLFAATIGLIVVTAA